jgi:hypothetical protein
MRPKIRFIGKYGEYRVGEIISPPGSLRKYLLDLRVAEIVEEKPPPKPAAEDRPMFFGRRQKGKRARLGN